MFRSMCVPVISLFLLTSPSESGFNRIYPEAPGINLDYDQFDSAVEIPGGYAAQRFESDDNAPSVGGLTFLDQNGGITGIIPGITGQIALFGDRFVSASAGGDSMLVIAWYDLTGNLVSQVEYDVFPHEHNYYEIRDVLIDAQGAILLCGFDPTEDSFVARIASDGTLDWITFIPNSQLTDVTLNAEGRIFSSGEDQMGQGAVFSLLDGVVDWSWDSSGISDAETMQTAPTPYGCAVANGTCVAGIDMAGNTLWVSDTERYSTGIAYAGEGSVVVYSCSFFDAGITRYDASGQIIWSRDLPMGGCVKIGVCSDGGFLMFGHTVDVEQTDPFDAVLIRTDSQGWFGPTGIEPGLQENSISVSLQSNPMSGYSPISITALDASDLVLKVFDVAGRDVAGAEWSGASSGILEFALPGLPSGVYTCVVSDDVSSVSERFVVLD